MNNGGGNVRGVSDLDVTILKINFTAPTGTNCLSLDFRFLSEEYPEYVGSGVSDSFVAELDNSTWTTTSGSAPPTAPNNFAFDQNGNPVSINTSGALAMSAAEAAGTTYDGATPRLVASTQLNPGPHTLYLSIFDQGDQILDSAVFVDNMFVGFVPNPQEQCQEGAQVEDYDLTLTPASATNTVGDPHTVTADVEEVSSGDPAAGNVQFTVTGANPQGPTVVALDSNGQADYTYTGSNAGDDTIQACYDEDGDNVFCEDGEATVFAQKTYAGGPGGVDGRMVSNASRGGASFASIIDCPAAVANAKNRPFTVRWSGKTFKLTNVTSVSCFDDPSFAPSPPPQTMDFDTQTGTGQGTVNGAPGYTLEWRLEDHGAPSSSDAARLRITRDSNGAVLLDVPLGALSSGQTYALEP